MKVMEIKVIFESDDTEKAKKEIGECTEIERINLSLKQIEIL